MDIFKLNRHLCRLLRKKVKIKQTEGVAMLEPLSCSLRFSESPKYNLGKGLLNSQNWRWESLGEPCEVSVGLGPASCVVQRAAGKVQLQSEQTCADDTNIRGSQLARRHVCGSTYSMCVHDNKDSA